MGNVITHALPAERGEMLLSKVAEGDVLAAQQILEKNRRLALFTHWMDGTSPLHAATCSGNVELVRDVLLAAQLHLADTRRPKAAARALKTFVNMRNGLGQTAMELACKFGHDDVTELLLAAGCKATVQDHVHGRTCLHYAAIHGRAACIQVLLSSTPLSNTAPNGPLIRESFLGDRRSHHKFVDAPAALGYAPLHLAVGHGHRAAVEALLQGGADPRARCLGRMFSTYLMPQRFKPACTPLHIAAVRGDLSICVCLLQSQLGVEQEGTEDLRALRDLCGDRPIDLVARSTALWALLLPDTPLLPALAQAEQELQLGSAGVASLAALAAQALRSRLLLQLAALQVALPVLSPHASPRARHGNPGHPSGGGEAPGEELSPQVTPHRRSRSREERRAAGLRGDLDDCDICMAACAGLRVAGCGHALCGGCAEQLCRVAPAGRAPGCPFCRAHIGAFCLASDSIAQ